MVHRENVKQLIKTSSFGVESLPKDKKVVNLIANGIKREKAQAHKTSGSLERQPMGKKKVPSRGAAGAEMMIQDDGVKNRSISRDPKLTISGMS